MAKDEDIRKTVDLKEDVVNAPITAGQELGTLTITYNDQVCAQVPLLAQADVSASRFLVAKAAVEAFCQDVGEAGAGGHRGAGDRVCPVAEAGPPQPPVWQPGRPSAASNGPIGAAAAGE